MRQMTKERLQWLDIAKGIGILLVVVGHMGSYFDFSHANMLVQAIYLFHMPLFFILSGYVFKPDADWAFIKARVKSLLVPYFAYLGIIFVVLQLPGIWNGTADLREMAGDAAKLLYGGALLKGELGVFWFVTCLFLTQVLYNFMINRVRSPQLFTGGIGALFLGGLAFGYMVPDQKLPWAIGVVPVALGYYAMGHLMRMRPDVTKPLGVFSEFILLVCGVCAWYGMTFGMDMKYGNYGPPLLGALLGFAFSWFVIEAVKGFAQVKITTPMLRQLGVTSLVIMFLHQFIHLSLRKAGVESDGIILIASVVLPCAAYWAFRQHAWSRQVLLGQKSPPPVFA
jgi:fucose 4-O-acetylase-like acetyltransferase